MPDRAPPTDAEIIQPEPTTVWAYVRAKFPYWAKRTASIFAITGPMHAALNARQNGYSLSTTVFLGIFGTAAVIVISWVIVAAVLTIGGWMKIKAKLPMWVAMVGLGLVTAFAIYRAATY